MRLNNKMYCHYEMVRNFPKSYIEDGTTMSVLGPQGVELKLFMERVEGSKNEYEVRVYKRPQDVFWMIDLKNNPHIKRIQEEDEYLSIFMDSYVNGRSLVEHFVLALLNK